ncbi:hypothetical protein HH310_08190 [Actinoplanes sp. TBRC 11911]|uniref:RNA polymerase sigma factor n=1 Tax=Actinoplanes sp. TBRC 11911 TaxID=2729386 RepID=UPI00145EF189|nr:sigma factor [Actinoplanes sp. TBRC 11911]NMO51165.1 hypothetical protein [Actinoplanes sp. TBRC 11911]
MTREQRLRSLHADNYADLLRFVERRVPPSEAEDVVSTVFLTAWRRLDDVPDDARPWLFAVARRTMANQSRSWLRRRALDVRLAGQDPAVVPDGAAGAAARVDLERAFGCCRRRRSPRPTGSCRSRPGARWGTARASTRTSSASPALR